ERAAEGRGEAAEAATDERGVAQEERGADTQRQARQGEEPGEREPRPERRDGGGGRRADGDGRDRRHVKASPYARRRCNALGGETPKLSVTDLVVRACALTMHSHPQLNRVWADGQLRQYSRSAIAVAVALAHGLMAPVLRGCDTMPMAQLAAALHDLVA